MLKKYFQPRSTIRKSFLFSDLSWNDRRTLEVELPAGNGVGTARAMARAYSAFAEGGAELGITPETFARITALPPTDHPEDEVIGIPTYFSLGFLRPGPRSGSARARAPSAHQAPAARSRSPTPTPTSATPT